MEALALERVTLLLTLMRRLGQVMDRERAILRGLEIEALDDLQQEKEVLAEAYEIELRHLRGRADLMDALDPELRAELFEAMRGFQDRLRANRQALGAAKEVVERVLRAIGDGIAKVDAAGRYGGDRGAEQPRGRVISLALDREI